MNAVASWNRLIISVFAMLISFAVAEVLSGYMLSTAVFGLGYAHYALGLKYSRRGVTNAWQQPVAKGLILTALVGSVLLAGQTWATPGIIVYFGIHHAISEAYFAQESAQVRSAHGVVVLGTYLAIIFRNLSFFPYAQQAGWVITAVGIAALLYYVKGQKGILNRFPWLVIGPAFLLLSHWVVVDWRVLTLFHFIFWGALPALRPGMIKGMALRKYWTETALANTFSLVAVFALYYYGLTTQNGLPYMAMMKLFFAWSYLHITWSFVVSGANPPWIKRLVGAA